MIDGILLFADRRLRELCDVKVYVDADADIRLIRRIERDLVARGRPLEEILTQYLTTVRPMHLRVRRAEQAMGGRDRAAGRAQPGGHGDDRGQDSAAAGGGTV